MLTDTVYYHVVKPQCLSSALMGPLATAPLLMRPQIPSLGVSTLVNQSWLAVHLTPSPEERTTPTPTPQPRPQVASANSHLAYE